MTRDREIPDRWPDSKSSKPGQPNGRRRTRRADAKRPLVRPASGAIEGPAKPSKAHQSRRGSRHLPPPEGLPVPQQLATADLPPPPPSKLLGWWKGRFTFDLRFWAILIVLFSSGVGITSIALLLKLP